MPVIEGYPSDVIVLDAEPGAIDSPRLAENPALEIAERALSSAAPNPVEILSAAKLPLNAI